MSNLLNNKDTIDQILRDFKAESGFLSCSLLHNHGEILTSVTSEEIDNEEYKINIKKLYEKFTQLKLFKFNKRTELISFKDIESTGAHILFNSFSPEVILIAAFKEQPQFQFLMKDFNDIVEKIRKLL